MALAEENGNHWEYEGAHGPAHWAEISHDYQSCAGTEQSPIDLNGYAVQAAINPPAVYWRNAAVTDVQNNGHTFQVALDNAGKIVIDGVDYNFLQFHFHSGSEHTLNGQRYPLEVHLVHQSADGRLAVIGVLFQRGASNPLLDQLIDVMPGNVGHARPTMSVNLNDFLPGEWESYRYQGSLTTPPCSEIVSWTVFEHPLTASADQFAVFETIFPHSYRPVQPTNRRFVLHTN
ncbi:MAG: hypothetical protein CMK05_07370 [Ponticaulis sp.]|nr:hypothetical protein [Ponticaulis sp.]|tara:strand:+ start:269335 stop:270030 length:696 start_codon:yes stop_codon:yes gene_type:complete